jgi:hypothetical protein
VQETSAKPNDDGKYARNTHSAIFAEVKIDEQIDVIRVTRVVNAVAAGRILNTKTGHSQIMGSIVWGIGMALHEETLIDHNLGRIMNADSAEYHVPVNADVHDIKVIFVDEKDGPPERCLCLTRQTMDVSMSLSEAQPSTRGMRDMPQLRQKSPEIGHCSRCPYVRDRCSSGSPS